MAPDALVDAMAQGALRAAGAPERITDGDVYEEVIVSGDTAAWAPEIPSGDEHDNPDVSLFSAPIKKIRDLQFLSEAQRDDQRVDLTGAVVFNSVDQALRGEDTGLINGSGIANEPLGMLNSPDLVTPINVAGTTANTISNTISDMGSAPKLINLMGALPSRFHASAVWMMHGSTFAAIRALVDAEGRPYFPEAYTANVLVGRPVILNDGVPEHGADGRKCVIFGSFARGFRIARKPGGIQIRILNERYSDRDLIGLRTIYRVGGGAILPQAFRVGVV
jgi:HK97 family phage major capsid protein